MLTITLLVKTHGEILISTGLKSHRVPVALRVLEVPGVPEVLGVLGTETWYHILDEIKSIFISFKCLSIKLVKPTFLEGEHCIKGVRIRSFSGPYFPAFGLTTDQKNSEYEHFVRSGDIFRYLLEVKILRGVFRTHLKPLTVFGIKLHHRHLAGC